MLDTSDLHGHSILIIESELTPFATQLVAAVHDTGAETLLVRDPYTGKGLENITKFKFTGALINAQHAALAKHVSMPTLVYSSTETVESIVSTLKKLLAA